MLIDEAIKKIDTLSQESVANIMDVLEYLKIDGLSDAQVLPGTSGKVIEVTNNFGKKYFFGLSIFGFVEIVRSDSITGEIVYAPLDD